MKSTGTAASPPPPSKTEPEEAPSRPESAWAVFLAFQWLALQGFGGVLPVAQRELVERRGWMTKAQFLELLSIGQVLPGPNIINLSLLYGDRCFGWRGMLAASGGLLLAPLLLVLAMAALYSGVADRPVAAGALRGMGAVACGLVIATAIKLQGSLRRNPLGRAWCIIYAAGTALLIGGLRWPMVVVVLGIGTMALLHTARQLRRATAAGEQP